MFMMIKGANNMGYIKGDTFRQQPELGRKRQLMASGTFADRENSSKLPA